MINVYFRNAGVVVTAISLVLSGAQYAFSADGGSSRSQPSMQRQDVVSARKVLQAYTKAQSLDNLASVLSDRSAAALGIAAARNLGTFLDLMDKPQSTDAHRYPDSHKYVEEMTSLFARYQLISHGRRPPMPRGMSADNFFLILYNLPQEPRQIPANCIRQGRVFLREFSVLSDQCSRAYGIKLPQRRGFAKGFVFFPVGPGDVEIRSKPPEKIVEPYVKSYHAVKEEGKWFLDVDPEQLL